MKIGALEQLILLAVLRLGEKAYGVSIQKELEERTGKVVALSAIYITLDRLVKKGYLGSRLGDPTPERGGRAKRYFTVLGLGETAINQSVTTFSKMAADLKLGVAQ